MPVTAGAEVLHTHYLFNPCNGSHEIGSIWSPLCSWVGCSWEVMMQFNHGHTAAIWQSRIWIQLWPQSSYSPPHTSSLRCHSPGALTSAPSYWVHATCLRALPYALLDHTMYLVFIWNGHYRQNFQKVGGQIKPNIDFESLWNLLFENHFNTYTCKNITWGDS